VMAAPIVGEAASMLATPRRTHLAAAVVANTQSVLTDPELLRAMFDVGYFPPNTPPPENGLGATPPEGNATLLPSRHGCRMMALRRLGGCCVARIGSGCCWTRNRDERVRVARGCDLSGAVRARCARPRRTSGPGIQGKKFTRNYKTGGAAIRFQWSPGFRCRHKQYGADATTV
jgi:hypothetical protein